MRRWWRIPAGPIFWMVTVQVAWTITLVAWISYFVEPTQRARELAARSSRASFCSCLMLAGVTVIVIHFGRQVAHNRAVKDFVSTVSPRSALPLATVKLHLETIQAPRDSTPEQQHACLDTALTSSGDSSPVSRTSSPRRGIETTQLAAGQGASSTSPSFVRRLRPREGGRANHTGRRSWDHP